MTQSFHHSRKQAFTWLIIFALIGIALTFLYPDGFQQDSGYHFLFARWGWKHPEMFVGVWARPLFTFLYSFPALLGFEVARLFTLAIGLATAWQTWKLARDLKLERSWLAVVLIFLQPSFFILFPDLLTEPLYALVFVVALRLHLKGRVKSGMLVASLLVLARPEGFFHGILWGSWILFDKRISPTFWRRFPPALWLATGGILWWLAAYIITKDPLYIKNNWPSQWHEGAYGNGHFWSYFLRLPEVVGPLLLIPFISGLVTLLKRREMGTLTSSFLCLFFLHVIFRALGIFGDVGYPRYMVCVAPAIAIITLVGWNALAEKLSHYSNQFRVATATAVLVISATVCILYIDGLSWIRDAWAVKDTYHWFQQNEQRPVKKLVWSQALMCVMFGTDPMERPNLTADREENLQMLRAMPGGTLIFWDSLTGPAWHNLKDQDFENIGYQRLYSKPYRLRGWIWNDVKLSYPGVRQQEMHLFYRE